MLRKLYLVPTEDYQSSSPKRGRKRPPCRRPPQRTSTEWIKLRTKHREAALRRNARTMEVADYMKQMSTAAIPLSPSPPPPI